MILSVYICCTAIAALLAYHFYSKIPYQPYQPSQEEFEQKRHEFE
jgi:hypothetical protein